MVRPLIILGAGGRIGRLLRLVWPQPAIWLTRAEWDILAGPAPRLPDGAVILDLAGVTRGDFQLNPRIADAVGRLASDRGARVIHLSSASVYPGGAGEMTESTALDPPSAYGGSKRDAEVALRAHSPDATILRVGNIAGADAVLGPRLSHAPIVLDPVPDGLRGPVRSYIGPRVLADALAQLTDQMARNQPLPRLMNLAQPVSVSMADLMDAGGFNWSFGPPRDGVIARVVLSTTRQAAYLTLPRATARGLVEDLRAIEGWP